MFTLPLSNRGNFEVSNSVLQFFRLAELMQSRKSQLLSATMVPFSLDKKVGRLCTPEFPAIFPVLIMIFLPGIIVHPFQYRKARFVFALSQRAKIFPRGIAQV
jgi:hypothetical protein